MHCAGAFAEGGRHGALIERVTDSDLEQVSRSAENSRAPSEHTGMTDPSFRFRLERVRALRERSEDAAKEALAGAMYEHRRCEQAVHTAADRIGLKFTQKGALVGLETSF